MSHDMMQLQGPLKKSASVITESPRESRKTRLQPPASSSAMWPISCIPP